MGPPNMPIDLSKVEWDAPSAAPPIDAAKVQWDAAPAARPTDAIPQGRNSRARGLITRPADISNIPVPTGAELADRWKDSVLGIGSGVVAAPFGLPGDIENIGRAVANRVMNPTDTTPYSEGTFFPTSENVADTFFGKPASAYEAGGRALGGAAMGLAGPAGAAALVAPLKAAETAAAISRGGTIARRAAQLGLDPLSSAIEGGGAVKNALSTAVSKAGEVIFSPQRNAANTLLRVGGAPEALEAIEATRGLPVTPNAPAATFAQRVAAQGNTNPAFAGLEQGLVNVNTATGREAYNLVQQRAQAIQDQLGRVDAQLQQQANAMAPKAPGDLQKLRTGLAAQLEQEQATLAALGESIAKGLPDVGQRAPGEAIARSAETMRRKMKTEEVTPRMEKPLEMAGNQPLDVQNIVAKAEEILGQPLSSFSPSTAPETVRILSRLQGQQGPGTFVQLGERGGYSVPGAQLPPTGTLRDLDAMRSAINKDYTTAAQSNAPGADARLRNIKQLHAEIDDAVKNSDLLPEIKAKWKEGSRFYREEYVPAAKTGITADMLKKTYRNVPTLLPDNVISSVLSNETNTAQIITSLKNSPEAGDALKIGIADKFRTDVVDKTTGLVDPAKADKFFKDNARNLNMLQDAGIDVQSSLQQARAQAANLKKSMDSLADTAKRLGKPEDAEGLVAATLKSSADMDFLYKRLNGDGRNALAYQLTENALAPIREGKPTAALAYLTDNAKAIKAGLGPTGNRIHADLVGMAKFQEYFQTIEKSAVKPTVPTVTQLQNKYSQQELTDFFVVADEIARVNKVAALAKQSGESARLTTRLATEEAMQGGVSAAAIPNKISSLYTTIKNVFKRNEARMNEKTSAALIYYMYKNPDAAAEAMRAALARQTPRTPITAPRPLTIPVGAAASATRLNAMAPQDAQ